MDLEAACDKKVLSWLSSCSLWVDWFGFCLPCVLVGVSGMMAGRSLRFRQERPYLKSPPVSSLSVGVCVCVGLGVCVCVCFVFVVSGLMAGRLLLSRQVRP